MGLLRDGIAEVPGLVGDCLFVNFGLVSFGVLENFALNAVAENLRLGYLGRNELGWVAA